jgi:DNA-binding CsgD family transcriptional regulator
MAGMTKRTRSELIGRTLERATVGELLQSAESTSRGGVLLVTGDRGIGKSALLDEMGAQAVRLGLARGESRAEAGDQASIGAPLVRVLRSGPRPLLGVPALTRVTELLHRPLVLVEDLHEHLTRRATAGPLLIVVDDLHRADRLTVFALRSLIPRLADAPVIWAFASRKSAVEVMDELSLPAGPDLPVTVLRLGPLDPEEAAALAGNRLGRVLPVVARSILDEAAGHPGLVLRITDGWAAGEPTDALPADFVAGIDRALGDRGGRLRELLEVAAALGRPFAPGEMAGLMDHWSPASVFEVIEQAVQEDWLAQDGPYAVAFRHDLVRQIVYGNLGRPERRVRHRRWMAYLLANGSAAEDIASHARGGEVVGDRRVVEVLRQAAEEAVAARPGIAAELIVEAFALARTDDELRWQTGGQVVDLLVRIEWFGAAVQVANTLRAEINDEPGIAADLLVIQAKALLALGQEEDLVSRAAAVLAAPGLSIEQRARLTAVRAMVLARRGSAAAPQAPADDDQAFLIAVESSVEAATNTGHHQQALVHLQSLRGRFGARWPAQEAMTLQLLDRYGEAGKVLADTGPAGDFASPLPSVRLAQLLQDFGLGRFERAEAGARSLIDAGPGRGSDRGKRLARSVLGVIAIIQGNLAQARAQVTQAGPGPDTDPDLVLVRSWLTAVEGDPSAAVQIMAPVLYSRATVPSYWLWWPGAARTLTMIGLAAGVDDFVEASVALAEEGTDRNPGSAGFAGVALQLRGLIREDLTLLERASQMLEGSPRPMLRASCADDYGRLLLQVGRRAEAVTQLDRAWDIYQELGDQQAMGLVRNAMNGLSARPDLRWEALTPAEIRVARLVSQGLTNRAAAQELGLSINTVGTHLRSVFAKLEVSSRVQLANAVNTHLRSVDPSGNGR